MDKSNDTLQYKKSIAIRNYTLVFVLLVLVAILSYSLGHNIELALLKLAVVPMFFLSFGGLQAIYRQPIIEHKFTPRSLEYSLLDGLLSALFIFVILWKPDETAGGLLMRFGVLVVVFSILKLVLLALDVKRLSQLHKEQSQG